MSGGGGAGHAAAGAGPRLLLRRLRELMGGRDAPEARLDHMVRLIAASMVAEVCSVYLLRPGDVLELYATQGLKQEAVHQTRLKVGEGLVGDVARHARPLNLADAWAHPNFAYRPETGEEIFHSLLGVPIIGGGAVIGVLVVQNRTKRIYAEEEVEAMQTVAMLLAEMARSGALAPPEELKPEPRRAAVTSRLVGLAFADGLAAGQAVLHQPRVEILRLVAENPAEERARLQAALGALRAGIDRLLASDAMSAAGEHREVIETFRLFAEDRGWIGRMVEAIGGGLTAEAAVRRIQLENRARMSQMADAYLRARLDDLEDLANRLLRHLLGLPQSAASGPLPEDAVLVARAMGPAELLDYDRAKLRALVLEEGAPQAHVAIVARALDIPVVGNLAGIESAIEPGDRLLVDGGRGTVFVRPSPAVEQSFAGRLAAGVARRAEYGKLRELPAETRDGERIRLSMNAGLAADLATLDASGADGIGLFRTELHFMVRGDYPGIAAQTAFYSRVLDRAGDRPVIFRTFDIGGDKPLPYLDAPREENPAMGWRAIRIGLDRPGLLRGQLRALLRAARGRELNLMFPMIAEVAEFDAAQALLDKESRRLARLGEALPARIRVGTMLEVPALYFQLDALLPRVHFVSVGSNDLVQFLFACDRGNAQLASRYDLLSPAALGFLKGVVERCRRAGVTLGLCGEAAGRPLEAMALIGLGFRSISMPPAAIGPVKAMVLSLDAGELGRHLENLLRRPDHSLRPALEAYAESRSVNLALL